MGCLAALGFDICKTTGVVFQERSALLCRQREYVVVFELFQQFLAQHVCNGVGAFCNQQIVIVRFGLDVVDDLLKGFSRGPQIVIDVCF